MDVKIKTTYPQLVDTLVEEIKQIHKDYHGREDIFYILGEV